MKQFYRKYCYPHKDIKFSIRLTTKPETGFRKRLTLREAVRAKGIKMKNGKNRICMLYIAWGMLKLMIIGQGIWPWLWDCHMVIIQKGWPKTETLLCSINEDWSWTSLRVFFSKSITFSRAQVYSPSGEFSDLLIQTAFTNFLHICKMSSLW